MRLTELLDELKVKKVIGETDIDVTGFQMDSRRIQAGNMFVVLTEPELDDRTKYIGLAVDAGAGSILTNHLVEGVRAAQVIVPNVQAASAKLARRFYNTPSNSLSLIGITGTKGKTTVSHLTAGLLEGCGIMTGIIGTAGTKYGNVALPYVNSTPHAIELQRLFSEMANSRVKVVLEADRRKAIYTAVSCAKNGDLIAILGKGNEPYQIIGHQKFDFDDRIVVREALAEID